MLNQKNIEYLVHRILSGKIWIVYDNIHYELRKPSLELKLKADLVYQDIYENNLYNEFFLLEDIPNLAIEIGIIKPEYKKIIEALEKRLENDKVVLFKEYFDLSKRKKNKFRLEQTRKQLTKELNSLHYLDYISLEHYAEKIKSEFIISHSFYNKSTNKLVFEYKNIEYNFFNTIMSEISSCIISVETYKEIARNEYWRHLWLNNKFKILNESVNEWSDEQKTMINIALMYDRIYEHPEAPSEDIVADDDALDGWMIYQKEENLKQKQEKGVDNMLSDKVKNSSEIFLMAPNKEQAENIRDLNSAESLKRMQQKIEFVISQEGPIKDAKLPDVKQDILKQLKGM